MELFRALGSLIEAPSPEHARVAAALGLPAPPTPAEHGQVVAQQRYPYASVYLGAEGMLGGEARDRIGGFWRALGLEGDSGVAPEGGGHVTGTGASARAPDHLASVLGLLAALEEWQREEIDPARQALLTQARGALIWEHLASWIAPYLATFEDCSVGFYQAWGSVLSKALDRLYAAAEFPDYLPAALRGAPGFADPRREGGPAFIASLLAPVRSGLILLRDDLERLGDDVGLACRAGERRYALNAFLAQDPGRTLGWLALHADRWSRRTGTSGPAPIAAWWSKRAENTAIVLEELAGEIQSGSAAGPLVAETAEPESPGDRPARAATFP